MLGIKYIATYFPKNTISNYESKEKFKIDDTFIEHKIGVRHRRIKCDHERTSDLCVQAFKNLYATHSLEVDQIECCVVVTQNPDYNIPHTAAIVHGKLGLPSHCACFDISLGCSGYVYGLSIIISFMKANNLKHGLLFTSDPYSDIIDSNDKNTSLLFGDAATVTYITENANLTPIDFSFGTDGSKYQELVCNDKTLFMNGRAVFQFTATTIPKHISELLEKNHLKIDDVDKFIFHQGSKFIVDTLRIRLKLDANKVPFDIYDYGNTVSSSIPIILQKEMDNPHNNTILVSGFGVGLSWGSAILQRAF